jgi:hypothetical protein
VVDTDCGADVLVVGAGVEGAAAAGAWEVVWLLGTARCDASATALWVADDTAVDAGVVWVGDAALVCGAGVPVSTAATALVAVAWRPAVPVSEVPLARASTGSELRSARPPKKIAAARRQRMTTACQRVFLPRYSPLTAKPENSQILPSTRIRLALTSLTCFAPNAKNDTNLLLVASWLASLGGESSMVGSSPARAAVQLAPLG